MKLERCLLIRLFISCFQLNDTWLGDERERKLLPPHHVTLGYFSIHLTDQFIHVPRMHKLAMEALTIDITEYLITA